MNENPDTLHTRAQALFQENRLKEALSIYQNLYTRMPADIQAWHMAGAIAGMLGEYATAKTCCEKVISLDPGAHGPYLNLGNILLAMGRHEDALARFRQALELKPDDPQTLTNLSNLYSTMGRLDEAIVQLNTAIRASPSCAEAYNNLGVVQRKKGDLAAAESSLRKALELRPGYIDALCNLGAVLNDRLEPDAAEACYREALRHEPASRLALRNYGNLHQTRGHYDEAEECYLRALSSDGTDIETASSLASLYERRGNHAAALALLEPLIASGHYNVISATTYAAICRRHDCHAGAIRLLEGLLASPVTLKEKANIHFALGELHDDRHEYGQAFGHFRAGNDIDADGKPADDHEESLRTVSAYFSKQRLRRLPRAANTSELPVFIVGMPRSGTTLVEQILASHPDVEAGGERGDISAMIDSLKRHTGEAGRYPDLLGAISQEQIDALASDYLKMIGGLAGGRTRFTDKTPFHGIQLGFINMLLPGSRVIVCKRNPADTCLSIYFHRFNDAHKYAASLAQLGAFYRHYAKLLEHWTRVLDIKLLEVHYEELVGDSERGIREIVDFCGLEWQPSCLSFYKNKRAVDTPSYNQVRQPIYSSSINRWKNYEQYLQPLLRSLQAGDD